MKTYTFIGALFLFSPGLFAQVAPAATAGARNFNYILRYSQSAQFGGSYGDWQTVTPSGEIDYSNGNSRAPFGLRYTGGYIWTLNGPSYSTGFFQRLAVQQQISGHKWEASLMDDVSYRPQAPTTGFSGIPGTGEPIGTPTPPTTAEAVLTLATHALYNTTSADVSRILTAAYSVSAGGAYDLLRFPDGNGLDTNTASAYGELTRRLNARHSLSGQYAYAQSNYPKTNFTFYTNTAMGIYERAWNRSLHTSIGLGPEWIDNSEPRTIPPSTMLSVSAEVSKEFRRDGSFSLYYRRGTAGGSGYMLGQKHDTVGGAYSRDFQRKLTLEMTAGYSRSTPLTQQGVLEYEFGGVQLHRRFGRHLSAFVNYTAMTQSSNMALPHNVVQHPLQTISFGMTYEPLNRNHY